MPVELEEWLLMLNKIRSNSVLDISNITYELIKQADLRIQVVFKNFANLCLTHGNILDKWKVAQIYTIPKGKDWGFELNRVRPIALLKLSTSM